MGFNVEVDTHLIVIVTLAAFIELYAIAQLAHLIVVGAF